MAKNYYDITLALAGICQSARLVQQLAHQGHCDADALHVSLNSVIDMNPSSTLGAHLIDPTVGQLVGAFVARVANVAAYPLPLHGVPVDLKPVGPRLLVGQPASQLVAKNLLAEGGFDLQPQGGARRARGACRHGKQDRVKGPEGR
mgnify:CR=1 FL=1